MSKQKCPDILYDVIVVGAGLSGLTAAEHLLTKCDDLNVLVLEAKDRVGGRTLTVDMKSASGSDQFDLGGQWVSDSQLHIMDLLSRLGIGTYPQYHDGKKFMQLNGAIETYTGSIPSLPILSLLDLQWFIYRFEKLCSKIDVNDPYSHPRAKEFDRMTVEAYQNKTVYTESTKAALSVAIRTTFGFETTDLSLLYVLTYAKAAGGLMKLFEATHGAAQEKRIEGGAQQVSKRLAERVGSGNVRLSSPVTGIVQIDGKDGEGRVDVHLKNGDVLRSKFVIFAIPAHLSADISFSPPLSDQTKQLLQASKVGHLTKYIATYSEAFWRTRGCSGEIVGTGGAKVVDGCDGGPITVVYDATSHRGSPALVGFLGGHQGTQWCGKSFEVRKKAILNGLSRFFGEEASKPLEFAEKIWSNEPYNGGCPVSVPSLGSMLPWTRFFKTPFGRVHWAGTEMATSWSGYMSGAVQSGVKAANDVLIRMHLPGLSAKDLQDKLLPEITKSSCCAKSRKSSGLLYFLATVAFGVLTFFYLFRVVE